MKRLSATIVACLLLSTSSAFGQYYFGRNKVHYESFEWQILKTDHFDIYFYPEMRDLAEVGASYAEEAYSRLENLMNHNVNRRIPLIFYSNHFHFQQTNTIPNLIPDGVGGFFEFLKGRVVIPSNGSMSKFKHVINHELVHVFVRSKVINVLRSHKRTQHPGLPLWFNEGIAEYWGEGWDSESEMFIRDGVLSGKIVPVSQMYRIYGTFLMYKEGQAICKFIAEEFGEEKLLQLIENLWKAESFSDVMKLTIGLNYKEFDREWLYYLQKKKYPLLEENDAPGMITRHLTSKGVSTKPTFAAYGDKREVVFVSNRIGYSNIYRIPYGIKRAEKDHLETLIKGERSSEFEAFNLLRSKLDANQDGLLTLVAKSNGHDALYVYSLETKEVVERFQFDDVVSIVSPHWSPEGNRIVFSATNYAGKRDLYILNRNSGALDKLTNDFYDDLDPAWSPDGKVIAFSSDRSDYGTEGAYNVFLYYLETGEIEYATYGPHNDFTPTWSPDGKSLALTSDRDGAFNIWLLQLAQNEVQVVLNSAETAGQASLAVPAPRYPTAINGASEMRKITKFTTGAFDPEWTDKGSLLFTAFENFSFQLRELDEVQEAFDNSEFVAVDTLQARPAPWEMPQLAADMNPTRVKYNKKFSLDIAQSQITQDPIFGASGGAQLAMSDMLGNDQYYFLIFNNAQRRDEFLESFNVAATRVSKANRINHALGLFHFAGNYFNRKDGFFFERRYGGFAALSYPLSVFRRLEASVNIRQSNKDWQTSSRELDALLFSNFVSYVKDNSLWGPSGPIDGERFNFTLGYTVDVRESNVNFYTIMADYRRYFRTSFRTAFATRVTARINHGKEAFPFFMGGSWDLRLYPRWEIWGEKTFLWSNEFRFPFIDRFALSFPFGGLGFTSIRGAAFVDIGNAWDNRLDELLGSYGFGARLRLGFLALRYDFGWRFTWKDLDDGISLGNLARSGGVHHQFFFGWDF